MSNDAPLTITLEGDLAARVRSLVESGEFASPLELIRAAMEALKAAEEIRGWSDDEIRTMVRESDVEGGEVPATQAVKNMKSALRARMSQAAK